MSLELMNATQAILEEVEDKSGKKIKYVEKKDLSMSAQFRLAGKQSPEHLLFYKPDHSKLINYIIANQCRVNIQCRRYGYGRRFYRPGR